MHSLIKSRRWLPTIPSAAIVAILMLGAACGDGPSDSRAEDATDTSTADVAADTVESPDTLDDTAPDVEEVASEDTSPEDTTPPNPFDLPGLVSPDLPETPQAQTLGCVAINNPDAESNNLNGWSITGGFEVIPESNAYSGAGSQPSGGDYMFAAGRSAESTAGQVLFLSADDQQTVTAGGVVAQFSLWFRDLRNEDQGFLTLEAIDVGGNVVASRDNGALVHSDWKQRHVALELPPSTVALRIEMRALRQKGTKNDANFDSLSLCLFDGPVAAHIADFPSPPYLMWATHEAVTVRFETQSSWPGAVLHGATGALGNLTEGSAGTTVHEIRISGLTPGQHNYYQVKTGDTVLPIADLRTAPAPDNNQTAERVEFAVVADNQDGPDEFRKLVERMITLDPQFLLHAGDGVQNGQRQEYRDLLWTPLYGLADRTPMLIGAGNHEGYASAIFPSAESRALWEEMVSQPGDEHCFGWRWGPLFVLVMDTERFHKLGSDQYNCAREALGSEDARTADFRVALFHRAPLIEYWDPVVVFDSDVAFYTFDMDAPDIREFIAPLFEAFAVDLVFNGHNHLYQYSRNYPATVDWVTTGGGGGGLESGGSETRVQDWSDYVQTTIFSRHEFLHVVIDDGVMGIRATTSEGEVLHEFQIYNRKRWPEAAFWQ